MTDVGGGVGVQNGPKLTDIIYEQPLIRIAFFLTQTMALKYLGQYNNNFSPVQLNWTELSNHLFDIYR